MIPGCPNGPTAIERVQTAVLGAAAGDVAVELTIVADVQDAVHLRMHGSPTILIDGRDPFAEPDSAASMSCRLYRTSTGLQGCPTVDDLTEMIRSKVR